MQAHEGRGIRGGRDHDGTPAILGAEDALDELLHFAASLADEPDDDDVRVRVARHHSEQHGFADAAARE